MSSRFFLISFFLISFFFANNGISLAQEINTSDLKAQTKVKEQTLMQKAYQKAKDALEKYYQVTLKKTVSKTFATVLQSTLRQMAYESANYIATGDKGQKPKFLTQGFGEYLSNIGDAALGGIAEELGKQFVSGATGGQIDNFSFCNPSVEVGLNIALGLRDYGSQDGYKPECTFSQMKDNIEAYSKDANLMKGFQDMFDPVSNDIGLQLSVNSMAVAKKGEYVDTANKDRQEDGGWNRTLDGIGDSKSVNSSSTQAKRTDAPGTTQKEFSLTMDRSSDAMTFSVGDALVDAANVFLNQLALKSFQEAMRKIAGDSSSGQDPYSGDYGIAALTNPDAGPSNSGVSGAAAKNILLKTATFNEKGDFDILSSLSACSNPNSASVKECVIDDRFRQAIQDKMTVGNALEEGFLNGSAPFGYLSVGTSASTETAVPEPSYMNGYPYRSQIILRKYRIIPIGWEVASQMIRNGDVGSASSKTVFSMSDMVNCFDANDAYGEIGGGYDWCRGLVDPNWVLKAPKNYCKKEGSGNEGATRTATNDTYVYSRSENYCADEQSCVKERKDGSCDIYGYCVEDRRIWNFGSESCNPMYNTCKTFKNNNSGASFSYLENTLDSVNCNVDNVGCSAYCNVFDFSTGKYGCTSTSTIAEGRRFFDGNATVCDAENEGCKQLIRVRDGLGANLLVNPDFEEAATVGGWNTIGDILTTDGVSGASSLKFKTTGTLSKEVTVGMDVYGQAFTLSFYSKNCSAGDSVFFEAGGDSKISNIASSTDWQYNNYTYIFRNTHSAKMTSPYTEKDAELVIKWNIASVANNCRIDSIKLEHGLQPTQFSQYGERAVIYEKVAPKYLSCDGSADPAECSNFARQCSSSEVGCELYTSQTDDSEIPAKAGPDDYCVGECVGFKEFVQSETQFDSLRTADLIPKTAKQCQLDVVGCDQFTNLDNLAKGGESVEYYSYLRQCVKPSDAGSNCASYYTWQGTPESGFQLVVVSLQASTTDSSHPRTTSNDSAKCNQSIYNLDPTDPSYNPDCVEFYDKDGDRTYHLFSKTISCNDNCHPYRRTAVNTDPALTTAASCPGSVGSDRIWDAGTSQCLVCKEGGTISGDTEKYCIYNAVPEEGISCSAENNGCREYVGSTGENVKIVLNNDFESRSIDGWISVSPTTVTNSTNALRKDGHSLVVSGGSQIAYKSVDNLIKAGKTYVLSFLASGSGALRAYINLPLVKTSNQVDDNSGNILTNISTFDLGSWSMHKVNFTIPADKTVELGDLLVFNGSGDFYIDDIKLTEVTDRYYLIADSWNTPDACNQDIEGNLAINYMLNCDIYEDRDKNTHYLKSFSSLCGDSAVGCELMIDTKNSTIATSTTVKGLETPADSYNYVVYDKDKICGAENKGCEMFGKQKIYGKEVSHQTTYLINNPDRHESDLCVKDEVGCDAWSFADGVNYFKNPENYVCEYRKKVGGIKEEWLIKKAKRCGGDGVLCSVNNDCLNETEKTCEEEQNEVSCNITSDKTIGVGGETSLVNQPLDMVGVCPAEENMCTELIDPISKLNSNLLFNADFEQDYDGVAGADGWGAMSQTVKIDINTSYVLGGKGNGTLSFDVACGTVNADLGRPGSSILLNNTADQSLIFFSGDTNGSCKISVTNNGVGQNNIYLRKVFVDYQFADKIDKTSCASEVNFENGCVLFNEKTIGSSMVFDAGFSSVIPTSNTVLANNNANSVIKVSPDRACDKWLSCSSWSEITGKTGDKVNVCTNIGLCNSFGSAGQCGSFINYPQVSLKYTNSSKDPKIANMTGYSKAGDDNNSMFNFSSMSQEGGVVSINNGDFESAGTDGYPSGWYVIESNLAKWGPSIEAVEWDSGMAKILLKPSDLQKEGIAPAADGSGVLAAGPGHAVRSLPLSFSDGGTGDYYISARVNTAKLKGGQVIIKVCNKELLTFENGEDWKYLTSTSTFTAAEPFGYDASGVPQNDCSSPQITIFTTTGANGSFYVDDVKIYPVLKYSKTSANTPKTESQSCRLYPDSSSPSCDYTDADSGIISHGWYGYCLERDRFPGNPESCLLWWPVEKVNGDNFSEIEGYNNGYNGKFPLYFCGKMNGNFRFVERRTSAQADYVTEKKSTSWGSFVNSVLSVGKLVFSGGLSGLYNVINGDSFLNPASYDATMVSGAKGCPVGLGYATKDYTTGWSCCKKKFGVCLAKCRYTTTDCVASSRRYKVSGDYDPATGSWLSGGDGWYEFNGSLIRWQGVVSGDYNTEIASGVKILDISQATTGYDGVIVDPEDYVFGECKKVYQTVGSDGSNRAWTARVSADSIYKTPALEYSMNEDDMPFGSAVPPEPVDDPKQWDTDDDYNGNQPLKFYYSEDDRARLGSPYFCEGGKCSKFGQCRKTGNTCISMSCNNDLCPAGETASTNVGVFNATCQPVSNTTVTSCIWQQKIDSSKSCSYYDPAQDDGSSADSGIVWNVPSCAGLADPTTCCKTAGYGTTTIVKTDDAGLPQGCTGVTNPIYDSATGACSGGVAPSTSRCSTVAATVKAGAETWFRATTTTVTPSGAGSEVCDYMDIAQEATTSDWIRSWNLPEYSCELGDVCDIPEDGGPGRAMQDPLVSTSNVGPYTLGGNRAAMKRLFAKSYGSWLWTPDTFNPLKGEYIETSETDNWDVPTTPCAGNVRPAYAAGTDADFCYISPVTSNRKLSANSYVGSGFVNMTFNSSVDPEQIPMTSYTVDWGDGEKTVVSGDLIDRPREDNPHSLFHNYDYWGLQLKKSQNIGAITCSTGPNKCTVSIYVKIMDNWDKSSTNDLVGTVTVNEP